MGAWQRWKEWERNWTLSPCKYCDTHADAPLTSWKNGSLHRWWCPALTRKLGWGAIILPVYFRLIDVAWWLCMATGVILLALSLVLPWLAKRYGPVQGGG